jgi:hypothetical protein
MSAARCPSHLLLFDEPLGDDLVDCAPQLFGADVNQSIARLVGVQCDMIE